jgi:23S rRNA pseudouridine1911/1915/1917 synthase
VTSERQFTVEAAAEGERLDRFLTARCPDFSRSQIQNALQDGRVTVNDRVRTKGHRLREGDRVGFVPPPPPATAALPQDIPLDVLFEDEDIVVVNKPTGLVTHPAPGHADGTLVNALLHRFPSLEAGANPLRPGIVHRLDRDTSGLIAVARSELALQALADQLLSRRMGRIYLALSWGRWAAMEGSLTGAIGRHPRDRKRMAVRRHGGREAVTHYRVEEDFDFVQLCRVQLETGRTHQIRVHFAHHGHPLVGDPLYGDDRRARNVRPMDRTLAARLVKLAHRQLLHAVELELDHPRTGERLRFSAPVPSDFAAALELLRPDKGP